MNLVITHNKVAFEKFMLPYVYDLPYEVLILKDGYFKVFKFLLFSFFDSKKYTVYTQHPFVLVFFIFFLFKFKFKWIHFVTGQVWVGKPWYKSIVIENLDRLLLHIPDYRICDSKGQFQFLSDRWKGKPTVHFCGIGSMGGISLPNQFSCITSKRLRISWIGRDSPDKDLNTLLKAFDLLNSVDKKLFIYGVNGEDTSNIHYLGFVEDILSSLLSNQINVNVVTSHREGFCLSILESASIGIPTISTNIYGTSEIIEQIKMNDYCFQVSDETQLLNSLRKYSKLNSEQRLYLHNASLSVNTSYNRENVIKKFRSLIG